MFYSSKNTLCIFLIPKVANTFHFALCLSLNLYDLSVHKLVSKTLTHFSISKKDNSVELSRDRFNGGVYQAKSRLVPG